MHDWRRSTRSREQLPRSKLRRLIRPFDLQDDRKLPPFLFYSNGHLMLPQVTLSMLSSNYEPGDLFHIVQSIDCSCEDIVRSDVLHDVPTRIDQLLAQHPEDCGGSCILSKYRALKPLLTEPKSQWK